jgi:hypothetical protein
MPLEHQPGRRRGSVSLYDDFPVDLPELRAVEPGAVRDDSEWAVQSDLSVRFDSSTDQLLDRLSAEYSSPFRAGEEDESYEQLDEDDEFESQLASARRARATMASILAPSGDVGGWYPRLTSSF